MLEARSVDREVFLFTDLGFGTETVKHYLLKLTLDLKL